MQLTKGFELFTKTFQEQYNIDANMLRGVAWEVWQNELSKSDREAWESMAAPKPEPPLSPTDKSEAVEKTKSPERPPASEKKPAAVSPPAPEAPAEAPPKPRKTEASAAKPKPKKQVEHKVDVGPQPAKDTPLPEKAAVNGKPGSEEALHRDTPPPPAQAKPAEPEKKRPEAKPAPASKPSSLHSTITGKIAGLLKMRGSETPAKKEPAQPAPQPEPKPASQRTREAAPRETVAPSPHQTAAMRPAEPAPPAAPVPPQKKEEALAEPATQVKAADQAPEVVELQESPPAPPPVEAVKPSAPLASEAEASPEASASETPDVAQEASRPAAPPEEPPRPAVEDTAPIILAPELIVESPAPEPSVQEPREMGAQTPPEEAATPSVAPQPSSEEGDATHAPVSAGVPPQPEADEREKPPMAEHAQESARPEEDEVEQAEAVAAEEFAPALETPHEPTDGNHVDSAEESKDTSSLLLDMDEVIDVEDTASRFFDDLPNESPTEEPVPDVTEILEVEPIEIEPWDEEDKEETVPEAIGPMPGRSAAERALARFRAMAQEEEDDLLSPDFLVDEPDVESLHSARQEARHIVAERIAAKSGALAEALIRQALQGDTLALKLCMQHLLPEKILRSMLQALAERAMQLGRDAGHSSLLALLAGKHAAPPPPLEQAAHMADAMVQRALDGDLTAMDICLQLGGPPQDNKGLVEPLSEKLLHRALKGDILLLALFLERLSPIELSEEDAAHLEEALLEKCLQGDETALKACLASLLQR